MVGNFQVVNVATQSVVTQLSLCDTQSSKIAIFCSDIKIGYHFSTINHVKNLCNSMTWPFIIFVSYFVYIWICIINGPDHVKISQRTFALLYF